MREGIAFAVMRACLTNVSAFFCVIGKRLKVIDKLVTLIAS